MGREWMICASRDGEVGSVSRGICPRLCPAHTGLMYRSHIFSKNLGGGGYNETHLIKFCLWQEEYDSQHVRQSNRT